MAVAPLAAATNSVGEDSSDRFRDFHTRYSLISGRKLFRGAFQRFHGFAFILVHIEPGRILLI